MEGKRFLAAGEVLKKGGEEDQVEDTTLKRRISGHPMYGLLKETHLNCLKACLGDEEVTSIGRHQSQRPATSENQSDLDQFMEAYCMALVELKQAIQDPMQEATTFIEFMYYLLDDLSSAHSSDINAAGSLEVVAEEERVLVCNLGGSMEDAIEKLVNTETGSELLMERTHTEKLLAWPEKLQP